MAKTKISKHTIKQENEFMFIDKAVFFPTQGILAVGDLHIGYEHMMDINLPETQTENIIENLKKIFSEIKSRNLKLKKIVFLGDIKHYFGFQYREMKYFDEILNFLKQKFKDSDIILIKGNHDKIDYSDKKMKNYYINNRLCFTHGHMPFPEIFSERVHTIVMGHLHPSVIISDKAGIKREKFKCFLIGKFHSKKLIVLPSFFEIIEGTNINDYKETYGKYFSIVPKSDILNSEVFVIGKDKTYDFGKVKNLD